jgi:hypothetical protein
MEQSKLTELKSRRLILGAATVAIALVTMLIGGLHAMTVEGNNQEESLPNVVLVHGA